jgi:hypothetical protein
MAHRLEQACLVFEALGRQAHMRAGEYAVVEEKVIHRFTQRSRTVAKRGRKGRIVLSQVWSEQHMRVVDHISSPETTQELLRK